ncbi:MAG: hypothetical protein ACO2ZM_09345 [Francisellaceae bacterium]
MKINSDILINFSAFSFLKELQAKIPESITALPWAAAVSNMKDNYNANIAYGDIYSAFMLGLEDYIEPTKTENDDLKVFVKEIFLNQNTALDMSYYFYINAKENQGNATISQYLKPEKPINATNPSHEGSPWGRWLAMISLNFKPMYVTSLPSIRKYAYRDKNSQSTEASNNSQSAEVGKDKKPPIEIRMSTPAQRHQGEARVSPIFTYWVERKSSAHLSINLLGRDRNDFEGRRERALGLAMHKEAKKCEKWYVVTLPADKGLMSRDYRKRTQEFSLADAKKEILKIACSDNGKDFHIPDKVMAMLLSSSQTKVNLFAQLLDQAAALLGLESNANITAAQHQALYMVFIRYSLTNTLIKQIAPETFNISCKDGIDRGASHSLIYHLFKSIEKEDPITEQEFEKGLHAAAILVKGRTMNHHIEGVWNVVDVYLNAQKETPEKLQWLEQWRDNNLPKFHRADSFYNTTNLFGSSRSTSRSKILSVVSAEL